MLRRWSQWTLHWNDERREHGKERLGLVIVPDYRYEGFGWPSNTADGSMQSLNVLVITTISCLSRDVLMRLIRLRSGLLN